MRIGGGVRSLNARLARLEGQIVEPQGPVVYSVFFADGAPLVAGLGEYRAGGSAVASAVEPGPGGGQDLVFRIASWEESALSALGTGVAHRRSRAAGRG